MPIILAEARALTVNQSALAAVDRLEQVWQLLEESGSPNMSLSTWRNP